MSRTMPIAPITVSSASRSADAFSVVGMISPEALCGFRRAFRVTRGPERRRQRGRHRRPISRSRRATWFALRLSAAPLPASSDPDGDDDHDEPDHRNAPRNRAPRPLRPVSPRAVLYKGSVGRRPRPRAESLAAPAHPLAVSGAVVSTPSPRLSPAPVSKLFCNFRSSGLASHPRRCRSVGSPPGSLPYSATSAAPRPEIVL